LFHRLFSGSCHECLADKRNFRFCWLAGSLPSHAKNIDLFLQFVDGRMRTDDPPISDSCRPLHRRVGVCCDPYWRARLLQRLGINGHICDLEFLALIADMIFRPEPFDDLNTLDEAPKSLFFRKLEGVEFLGAIAETKGSERLAI